MTDLPAKLAELVGSRLCHDLISPIGAIQNGLELVAMSGSVKDGPEMTLIQDSCASATARIRFFRVAFGSAGTLQMMSRRETVAVLTQLTNGGRMSINWLPTQDQPRSDVQLAYLAFMCCETALPQGGTVTFERRDTRWVITATGPRVSVDPDLWHHLAGVSGGTEITPDKVQFAMLATLARDRSMRLQSASGNEGLRIEIG